MKRWVIRTIVLGVGVLLVLIAWQSYLASRDRAANRAFGEKARQNHIKDMTEEAVVQLFGVPDHAYRYAGFSTVEPYHVLVYIPGPRLAFWRSECKITIDDNTGRVRAWMINSD